MAKNVLSEDRNFKEKEESMYYFKVAFITDPIERNCERNDSTI